MPQCTQCSETFADNLRRCPHCGEMSEGSGVTGGLKYAKPDRVPAAVPRWRQRLPLRGPVILAAASLLGLGIAVVLHTEKLADPEVPEVPYEAPHVVEWEDFIVGPPDEIETEEAGAGFEILAIRLLPDSILVEGSCSPLATASVRVNGLPAALDPEGSGFQAFLPLTTSEIEVAVEGIGGDEAVKQTRVPASAGTRASERPLRLLSHTNGSTVYERDVRVHVGTGEEGETARALDVTLDDVVNLIEVDGCWFALYRAPQGLVYLRTNEQGAHTFLRRIDGQEMILVPGGVSRRGRGEEHPDGPAHVVRLSPFLIDRNEVTCRQYARFLRFMSTTGDAGLRHYDDPGVRLRPVGWESLDPPPGQEELPVRGVCWYSAYAYARWVGGRLPTEAEWERAAAGPLGHAYPWGAAFDPLRCRTKASGPVSADSMPAGESVYGLLHMSGNAREWCHDRHDPRWYSRGPRTDPRGAGPVVYKHRAVRGGSFASDLGTLTMQCRDHLVPTQRPPDVGFRVAQQWIDLSGPR